MESQTQMLGKQLSNSSAIFICIDFVYRILLYHLKNTPHQESYAYLNYANAILTLKS